MGLATTEASWSIFLLVAGFWISPVHLRSNLYYHQYEPPNMAYQPYKPVVKASTTTEKSPTLKITSTPPTLTPTPGASVDDLPTIAPKVAPNGYQGYLALGKPSEMEPQPKPKPTPLPLLPPPPGDEVVSGTEPVAVPDEIATQPGLDTLEAQITGDPEPGDSIETGNEFQPDQGAGQVANPDTEAAPGEDQSEPADQSANTEIVSQPEVPPVKPIGGHGLPSMIDQQYRSIKQIANKPPIGVVEKKPHHRTGGYGNPPSPRTRRSTSTTPAATTPLPETDAPVGTTPCGPGSTSTACPRSITTVAPTTTTTKPEVTTPTAPRSTPCAPGTTLGTTTCAGVRTTVPTTTATTEAPATTTPCSAGTTQGTTSCSKATTTEAQTSTTPGPRPTTPCSPGTTQGTTPCSKAATTTLPTLTTEPTPPPTTTTLAPATTTLCLTAVTTPEGVTTTKKTPCIEVPGTTSPKPCSPGTTTPSSTPCPRKPATKVTRRRPETTTTKTSSPSTPCPQQAGTATPRSTPCPYSGEKRRGPQNLELSDDSIPRKWKPKTMNQQTLPKMETMPKKKELQKVFGGSANAEKEGKKTKKLNTVAAGCKDRFDDCKEWAMDGECDRNPFWMKPNCQNSCQSCGVSVAEVDDVPKENENCKNKHELCQFWKNGGECEANVAYMKTNCPLSCEFC